MSNNVDLSRLLEVWKKETFWLNINDFEIPAYVTNLRFVDENDVSKGIEAFVIPKQGFGGGWLPFSSLHLGLATATDYSGLNRIGVGRMAL